MLQSARARAAESAFEAAGATIRLVGDECLIDAPDYSPTLMAVVSHLPDVRRGESYDAYQARLTTDPQREELRDRTRRARRRSRSAFRAAGELLGDGSARFRMIAGGLVTEERVAMAEEAFAAARRGVLEWLRSLAPPPPTAVTSAIENTAFADLRAFLRLPSCDAERGAGTESAACQADLEAIRRIEASCTASGRALGDLNAVNLTDPARGSTVSLCPAALLTAEASSPRTLVSVLAHELGHSIDPCSIGMLDPSVRACFGPNVPPVPGLPGEVKSLVGWNERLDGTTGWARCMTVPQPPARYTGVSYGNQDYSARVLEAMAADGPQCLKGEDSPQLRCLIERNLIRGPARHCFMNAGNLIMDAAKCPGAHRLGMGYGPQLSSDVASSEVRESYSDFIASRALPRALESYDPPLSVMGPAERASETLTTMPFYCGSGGFSFEDTHSSGRTRIGVFASSPEIRGAVGCSPAVAVTSESLPTAHCGGLFDRNEPFRPPVEAPTEGRSK